MPVAWRGKSSFRKDAAKGLIAAAAKRHNYEVWHFGDEHFKTIAEMAGAPQRDLKF